MNSQSRSELRLSPNQIDRFAARIYQAVRREVSAYGALTDPDVNRDFAEINRRNVEVFFGSLSEDRVPTNAELAVFEEAARRRLHQGVPLEAIFHSYRVGVRVLWECLLEVAPQQDHGRLAVLALEYADRVSTAAAQAYIEERQCVAQSRHDAARLLLTRIVHGQVGDDAATSKEAVELGLDLAEPRFVLIVTGSQPQRRPSTRSDLTLANVRSLLQSAIPDALVALLSDGLVALVPADAEPTAEAAARNVLAESLRSDPAYPLAVGVGTAGTGTRGLAISYQEAVRAHALGRMLEPDQLVHRYGELSLFDLFKEGAAMDAFVGQALRPLLELDARRRQRMLDTLEALFSAALNRKVTARRLGVHQNTLSHRIRRLEHLLGGSFASGEFCFRVQLALRLLPLTQVRQ